MYDFHHQIPFIFGNFCLIAALFAFENRSSARLIEIVARIEIIGEKRKKKNALIL